MPQQTSRAISQTESTKADAGRKSGASRTKRAEARRLRVMSAFDQLDVPHQRQPYSNSSVDALLEILNRKPLPREDQNVELDEYEFIARGAQSLPSEKYWELFDAYMDRYGADFPTLGPYKRETVIKDLKALGITSKHRPRRSGYRTPFAAKTT